MWAKKRKECFHTKVDFEEKEKKRIWGKREQLRCIVIKAGQHASAADDDDGDVDGDEDGDWGCG